jgi:GNAT superfamily N-acetyltransferase
MTVVVRRADRLDVPFMRSLLGFAYNWHVMAFETDVSISHYVDGWGREGDAAVIAMDGGHSVGAGWYRLFTSMNPGYGFVDEETPELTIAVVPSRRRHGVGQELLDALLEQARAGGHQAVSLSVEQGSPAVAFYERNGFAQVGDAHSAFTMLKRL